MEMFEYTSPTTILFFMLYGGAAILSALLCFYLLLRRGNAIAADITPPIRLRRWAASFFALGALGHVWWYLFYAYSYDALPTHDVVPDTGMKGVVHYAGYVVVVVLDCVTMPITIAGTLLAMLQDRRRPVYPVAIATIPIMVLGGLQIAFPGKEYLIPALIYTLALYVTFTVYMFVAVRQYGRWLLDNYADLEHKEVWWTSSLLLLFLLLVTIYGFASDSPSLLLMRVLDFLLFALLLWRVETLPPLEAGTETETVAETVTEEETQQQPSAIAAYINLDKIEQQLKTHCIDTHLYLQHDLTLNQLAHAIGTNRSYLSLYFSRQGITYNTYINNLRITHFINLCQETTQAGRPVAAQQLASDSGYRSYSTFSLAFKQRMGQTVTAWLRDI